MVVERVSCWMLVAVVAVAMTTPTVALAAQDPLDCAVVAALVDARLLSDALEELGPTGTCDGVAADELEASIGDAAGLAARAKSAHEHNNDDAARLLALGALALDAGNTSAQDVLDALVPAGETPDPFVVARALQSKGFETEAHEVVVEALKAGASAERVTDGLDNEPDFPIGWYSELSIFSQLLLAMLAVVVAALIARVVNHSRRLLKFSDGFGDDAGALAALTRVRLRQLTETHNVVLQIGGNPEAEVPMPQFGDVDARLKVLDTLIKAITTPRPTAVVLGIGGGVDAPNIRRATAELHRGKTCTSTSWRVIDHADDNLELEMASAYAAGWTLLAAQPAKNAQRESFRRAGLPTGEARSYGALLAGNAAFTASDIATSRRYYSEALSLDASNYAAEANLALAIGTSASTSDISVAIAMLSALLGTEDQAGPLPAGSVERQRAHFNRASLTANLLASVRSSPEGSLPPGSPTLEQLVVLAFSSVHQVLEIVRTRGPGGEAHDGSAMSAFADLAATPATVLAAGLTLEVGMHQGLALPDAAGRTLELAQVVLSTAEVKLAPPKGPNTPSGLALSIIDAVSQLHSPSAKTHYNLACCFTRRREFDRAVTHLRRSLLVAPGIWVQAVVDPVLAPLRERLGWVELVKAFGPAPKKPAK